MNDLRGLMNPDAVRPTLRESRAETDARRLAGLIDASPDAVLGRLPNGLLVLDMSLSPIAPGEWGRLLARNGTRRTLWLVRDSDSDSDATPTPPNE